MTEWVQLVGGGLLLYFGAEWVPAVGRHAPCPPRVGAMSSYLFCR